MGENFFGYKYFTPTGLGMGENFFGYKYFTPTGFLFLSLSLLLHHLLTSHFLTFSPSFSINISPLRGFFFYLCSYFFTYSLLTFFGYKYFTPTGFLFFLYFPSCPSCLSGYSFFSFLFFSFLCITHQVNYQHYRLLFTR